MEMNEDRKCETCKFLFEGFDWVPMPFGSGNVKMPVNDCLYNGEIDISDPDYGVEKPCPAWSGGRKNRSDYHRSHSLPPASRRVRA